MARCAAAPARYPSATPGDPTSGVKLSATTMKVALSEAVLKAGNAKRSRAYSRAVVTAASPRNSTAGSVIRVMLTASAWVSSDNPGAAMPMNGSASTARTTTTPPRASATVPSMAENVRRRRVSSCAMSLNTGMSAPATAPPMTRSWTSCGIRVATSRASALPVVPNNAAITDSRTMPRTRLSTLPPAISSAASATLRPIAGVTVGVERRR